MIDENFLKRMYAQAEEAEIQGLNKISKHLTRQLEKLAQGVESEKFDLDKFMENKLWDMFTKYAADAACIHTSNFDAAKVQSELDHIKNDLKSSFRNLIKDSE